MHVYVKISFHVKCMYFLCKIMFLSYVNSKEIKSQKKKKMFRNVLQVRLPAGKSVKLWRSQPYHYLLGCFGRPF